MALNPFLPLAASSHHPFCTTTTTTTPTWLYAASYMLRQAGSQARQKFYHHIMHLQTQLQHKTYPKNETKPFFLMIITINISDVCMIQSAALYHDLDQIVFSVCMCTRKYTFACRCCCLLACCNEGDGLVGNAEYKGPKRCHTQYSDSVRVPNDLCTFGSLLVRSVYSLDYTTRWNGDPWKYFCVFCLCVSVCCLLARIPFRNIPYSLTWIYCFPGCNHFVSLLEGWFRIHSVTAEQILSFATAGYQIEFS